MQCVEAACLVGLMLGLFAVDSASGGPPCLDGRKGITRKEILQDDWACFTYCKGESSTWDKKCKLCCPVWLGGEGNDIGTIGPPATDSTSTSNGPSSTSPSASSETNTGSSADESTTTSTPTSADTSTTV